MGWCVKIIFMPVFEGNAKNISMAHRYQTLWSKTLDQGCKYVSTVDGAKFKKTKQYVTSEILYSYNPFSVMYNFIQSLTVGATLHVKNTLNCICHNCVPASGFSVKGSGRRWWEIARVLNSYFFTTAPRIPGLISCNKPFPGILNCTVNTGTHS